MPISGPSVPASWRATVLWASASVVGLIATRAWFSNASGVLFEDALITLRYAENLASGRGFVFNVGERVLGTTTPLFTLLLACLALPAGVAALPKLAIGLGILSDAGTVMLLFALSKRARLPVGVPVLGAALLAAGPYTGVTSVSGMETSLVVFLMFASLTLVLCERPIAASAVLGMLVLTRIDAVLWVAVLAVVVAMQERRLPWREALCFTATVLPWVVFATYYFGSAVPNTIAAKLVAYPMVGHPGERQFLQIWNPLHEFDAPALARYGFDALLLLGAIAVFRSHRALLALPIFFIAYFGLLFFKVPQIFPWYLVPLIAVANMIVAIGAGELWRLAARLKLPFAGRLAPVAALPLVLVLGEALETRKACRYWAQHMENERSVREAAGRWLREISPEHATIYAEPIGFLGYYSKRFIWDSVGLVSPHIIQLRRESADNGWFAKSLRELQPDYVVLRTFEHEKNVMFPSGGPLMSRVDLAWFDDEYLLVREFRARNELWGLLGQLSIFALRSDVRKHAPRTPSASAPRLGNRAAAN